MTPASEAGARRCPDTGSRDGPEERDGFALAFPLGSVRQVHGGDPWRLQRVKPAGRDLPLDLPLAGEPRPDADRRVQRAERPDDPDGLSRQRAPLAPARGGWLDPARACRQRPGVPAGVGPWHTSDWHVDRERRASYAYTGPFC